MIERANGPLGFAESAETVRIMGDAFAQMVWSARPDGWIDWYNQRWYDYTGQSRADAAGWGWQSAHHPDDLPDVMRRWPDAIARRETFEMEFRLKRVDGAFRWFLTRAVPLFSPDGTLLRWYGTNIDINDRREEYERQTLFAQVGETIGQAISLDDTLRAISHLIVPKFADWMFVNLLDADGRVRLAQSLHRDPAHNARAAVLLGKEYGRSESDTGSAAAIRSATSRVYPVVNAANLGATMKAEYIELFEEIGVGSAIIVPMIHAGKAVGTLSLMRSPGGGTYTREGLPLFEELASRLAPAIGNAHSYERERRIAQTFQRAALSDLPRVPGLTFDAIYEAGKAEAQVGGDWYDAFVLGDGRVVISIGDVAGSGLDAAVTMSNVRQSIRTAALMDPRPSAILDVVDRSVRMLEDDRLITAFVAILDLSKRRLTYDFAGHPPAFVRRADGSVVVLDSGSLPLGLRSTGESHCSTCELDAGSTIVLYTDGLTESGRDAIAGEAAVRRAIANLVDPSDAAHVVFRSVLGAHSAGDDIAILAVTLLAALPEEHRSESV